MSFEEGQTFKAEILFDQALIDKFVSLSGDINPIHVDADEARRYGHSRPVAHGAIMMAVISRLIGMEIPGPGAIWLHQEIDWLKPVYLGDQIDIRLEIRNWAKSAAILTLEASAYNQNGEKVMEGESKVKVGQPLSKPGKERDETSGTIVISGGSRGIGAAIAEELACAGYHIVVIFNNNEQAANAVSDKVRQTGQPCQLVKVDLSKPFLLDIPTDFPPVSGLVHCATAGIDDVAVEEMSNDALDRHMQVTMSGAIALVSQLAPQMINQGNGRIIFMGTIAMETAPPNGWAPYLVAKHALWGYARSLAVELGPRGITTNMISPSMIVTDLTEKIPHRAKEIEARRNPRRRLATVDDVSNTVSWLMDTKSGFVNGQNIIVSGGA